MMAVFPPPFGVGVTEEVLQQIVVPANTGQVIRALMWPLAYVAGVLLLWWKLHRFRMDTRNWRRFLPPNEPGVYIPRIPAVWTAPEPKAGSYRDDTGTQQ